MVRINKKTKPPYIEGQFLAATIETCEIISAILTILISCYYFLTVAYQWIFVAKLQATGNTDRHA